MKNLFLSAILLFSINAQAEKCLLVAHMFSDEALADLRPTLEDKNYEVVDSRDLTPEQKSHESYFLVNKIHETCPAFAFGKYKISCLIDFGKKLSSDGTYNREDVTRYRTKSRYSRSALENDYVKLLQQVSQSLPICPSN